MKNLLWLFTCLFVVGSYGTTFRTEPIDGSDTFAGDELMDTDVGSGIEFRLTWDADFFYFSIEGAFDLSTPDDWWVFIDVDQVNGSGATSTSPSPSVVTFNGSADTDYEPEFAVHVASPSTATFFVWLGSAWDAGTPLATAGGAHAAVAGPPGYAEMSLPFGSLVGSVPHDGFSISSTVEDGSIVISAFPVENEAGTGGNTLPDVNWFYQFYTPHIPGPMPVAGFSPGTIDHSLPVSLSSFTAVGGNGQVTLKWITESEIENDAFLLERGINKENFELLKEIPGQGNSSQQHVYEFVDNNVVSGRTYYYRLADRDLDGAITYHPVISATPFGDENIELVDDRIPYQFKLKQNYPNPFNPGTNIEFELPATQKGSHQITLNIYDIQGRRISTLINGVYQSGHYKVFWNGKNEKGEFSSSGIYIYELKTENLRLTRKLMFIR